MASRQALAELNNNHQNNPTVLSGNSGMTSWLKTSSKPSPAIQQTFNKSSTNNSSVSQFESDSRSSASSRGSVPGSSMAAAITSTDQQRPPAAISQDSTNAPNQNNIGSRRTDEAINTSSTNYVPTKKCAIVIENTQTVSQDSALRAVADIISGANIHYVTRLSGARICMYLSNEECVNKLCQEGGIVIDVEYFPVRRYVTEATKFVVSNCPPEFSDDDLKKLLEPYGRIVSAPSRLRVNTSHDDLKHVKSWRRSIYIMIPSDSNDPPKRIPIVNNTDGTKSFLYVNRDDLVCAHCLAPGHIRENCKKLQIDNINFPTFQPSVSTRLVNTRKPTPLNTNPWNQPNLTSDPTTSLSSPPNNNWQPNSHQAPIVWGDILHPNNSTPSNITQESQPALNQPLPQQDQPKLSPLDVSITSSTEDTDFQGCQLQSQEDAALQSTHVQVTDTQPSSANASVKRVHSPTNDEDSSASSSYSGVDQQDKPERKKVKRAKEQLAVNQLMNEMKHKSSYLSQEHFRSFLSECRGKCNSKAVASKYTSDFSALIAQLNDAQILCKDFNLLRRLKRAAEALI